MADLVWALGPTNEIAVAEAEHLVDSGESRDSVLQLNSTRDVTFEIVSPNGAAVAGATVEPVNYRGGRGVDLIPDPICEVLRGTTDGAGHVRLHLGSSKFFNIRVTSEGFGIQLQRLKARNSATERTFALSDVGRIEGRVITKEPKDAIGVRLHFHSITAITEGAATAVTDERGNFVVPNLAVQFYHRLGRLCGRRRRLLLGCPRALDSDRAKQYAWRFPSSAL